MTAALLSGTGRKFYSFPFTSDGRRKTCAVCGEPAHWIRKGCRPLCGHHLAHCGACGRHRDTRHPNRTELCRACYNTALKALHGLLNDPAARQEMLNALALADSSLVRARPEDGDRARARLADLAIALGGRP